MTKRTLFWCTLLGILGWTIGIWLTLKVFSR